MTRHSLLWIPLVLLPWSLVACNVGGSANEPSALPTRMAVAQVQSTQDIETRAVPTPSATTSRTSVGSPVPTSTQPIVPTVQGPELVTTPTGRTTAEAGPDSIGFSEESQVFARQLQDAAFALENLPGYSYKATDSAAAPGLVLTAQVASTERREWTVSEQGAPDHILARWILLEGKAYTDVTGRWERVEELPFDTDSPISLGSGYSAMLFQPYGQVTNRSQKDARVGSRRATRHDIEIEPVGKLAEESPYPEGASTKTIHSLWVAKDGGYLLRYRSGELFDGSEAATRSLEVMPLSQAPQIQAPKVGGAVYEGNPPPWRAAVIGQQRLRSLRSYAFSTEQDEGQIKVAVKGQVSDSQGHVSGTMPDFTAVFEDFDPDNPPDPDEVKSIDVDVVYREGKIWARFGNRGFRRISTTPSPGTLQDTNALTLLALLPGGAPEGLLGKQWESVYEESLFGLIGPSDLTVLAGGRLVGTERVNGVQALHYKGYSNAGGEQRAELWLAVDGLYLVRSQESTPKVQGVPPGADPLPTDAGPGKSRIDIYDANRSFSVKVPVTH